MNYELGIRGLSTLLAPLIAGSLSKGGIWHFVISTTSIAKEEKSHEEYRVYRVLFFPHSILNKLIKKVYF